MSYQQQNQLGSLIKNILKNLKHTSPFHPKNLQSSTSVRRDPLIKNLKLSPRVNLFTTSTPTFPLIIFHTLFCCFYLLCSYGSCVFFTDKKLIFNNFSIKKKTSLINLNCQRVLLVKVLGSH